MLFLLLTTSYKNIMKKLEEDKNRYSVLKEMPRFQKYMRKGQEAQNPFCRVLYKAVFAYYRNKNLVEMPLDINIGGVIFKNCVPDTWY